MVVVTLEGRREGFCSKEEMTVLRARRMSQEVYKDWTSKEAW